MSSSGTPTQPNKEDHCCIGTSTPPNKDDSSTMSSPAISNPSNEDDTPLNKDDPVCVTGANGFIGSWLVKTLLEAGYGTIHASIFPGSDTSHLLSISDSAASRIRVFEADLLDYQSLSTAIKGCKGVFHVASPATLAPPVDPEEELVKPAVQGTLNVLEVAKNSGVRRVVITSSIAAIFPNPAWPKTAPFDESSWADIDYCKSLQNWYAVSKTLAEKAAWEFSKKHGADIVTILPSTVLGPLLQPELNASCAVLQQLLQGSKHTLEYFWLGAVHVKDVARAQVLLYETPTACGRYLCTNGFYQYRDFAAKVHELFPEYPIHRFTEETQPGLVSCDDAAKKLLSIGLAFTPIENIIRDSVESLKSKGYLT